MSVLYDALLKAEADRARRGRGDDATADATPARREVRAPRARRFLAATALACVAAGATSYARNESASRRELADLVIGRAESGIVHAPLGDPTAPVAPVARVEAAPPEDPPKVAIRSPATAPADVVAVTLPTAMTLASAPTIAPPVANGATSLAPRFSVQVGAFRNRSNAFRLRARLLGAHPSTTIEAPTAEGGFWIVRVGPYADRRQARAAVTALARGHVTGIVVDAVD